MSADSEREDLSQQISAQAGIIETSDRPGWFKALENRYPFGFLGLLATLILGIAGVIALVWSWPDSRSITYEVISNTPVVSRTDDVPALEITYGGENVRNTLRVLTIRILNDGSEFIRENDYATDAPLGIVVRQGELIDRPTLVEASNEYLRENFSSTLKSKTQAVFPRLIFNSGDYVLFKLLMVESPDGQLEFTPDGRVAGIDSLTMRQYEPPREPWWWSAGTTLLMLIGVLGVLLFIGVAIWGQLAYREQTRERTLSFDSVEGKDFQESDAARSLTPQAREWIRYVWTHYGRDTLKRLPSSRHRWRQSLRKGRRMGLRDEQMANAAEVYMTWCEKWLDRVTGTTPQLRLLSRMFGIPLSRLSHPQDSSTHHSSTPADGTPQS